VSGAQGFNVVGGELGMLHPDGTWTPVTAVAGLPNATAVEPDGTLWVTERFPVPFADGGFGPVVLDRFRTELRRYTPAGVATTVDTGGRFLTQLAARPGGGVWALDAQARTLVRVSSDGTLLEAPTPTVGSGKVFAVTGLAVDAVEGAVWAIDNLGEQLYRFSELADGGLHVDGVATPDDLPDGTNKRGFGGRIAVDPVSGDAVTFVGQLANTYARWVVVPSHLKRLERSGWFQVEQGQLGADPTSGHLWLGNSGVLRRVDVRGQVLVEVPHQASGFGGAPVVVDRLGRAWSPTPEGMPALRVIDTDGREVFRVPLPFEATALTLGSTMVNGVPSEVACAANTQGEIGRITLATRAVERLTLAGGSSEVPFRCAPLSDGRAWVIANDPLTNSDRGFLFDVGASTNPRGPVILLPDAGYSNQVVAAADQVTGDLYFATWDQASYDSALLRASSDGGVQMLRVLQGFVPGEGNRVGVALGVAPRRLCTQWVPECVELWVNNRAGEVRRIDGQGGEAESLPLGRGEAFLNLAP
jgi:hypothetical protein